MGENEKQVSVRAACDVFLFALFNTDFRTQERLLAVWVLRWLTTVLVITAQLLTLLKPVSFLYLLFA